MADPGSGGGFSRWQRRTQGKRIRAFHGSARPGAPFDGEDDGRRVVLLLARDALEIRALGLPVWCGGVRPLPYSKRLVLAERGVAVRCGGARVEPGDIVVADADGVAVVPKEKAEAVLERTRIVMEVEEEFTRRFEAGESGTELVKMMRRKWE